MGYRVVALLLVLSFAFVACGCAKQEAPATETSSAATSDTGGDEAGSATFGLTPEGQRAAERVGSKR